MDATGKASECRSDWNRRSNMGEELQNMELDILEQLQIHYF